MKIEKVEKLVANLHNKTKYVIYIRNLKQAVNHGLLLKEIHSLIKLKSYIGMNTHLRRATKIDLENDFFTLMNNSVFGKTMENVQKHRDIKLVTTGKKETIWCQNQIIILQIFSQKI